mgnify:CR=1 FL=1
MGVFFCGEGRGVKEQGERGGRREGGRAEWGGGGGGGEEGGGVGA